MKATWIIAALALGVAPVWAQAPQTTPQPSPAQGAPQPSPAQKVPEPSPAQKASQSSAAPAAEARDTAAGRAQMRMMENVLAQAVRAGAETLGRQMQIAEPGSLIVTGTARARGIILDGYGVFFDVDVPMMKQSVIWSRQMMIREELRTSYRAMLAQMPEGPDRQRVRQALAELERPGASLYPTMPLVQAAPPGTAAAQTVNDAGSSPPAGTAPAAAAPAAPAIDTRDPNEQYTEAVKAALINAMLDYNFNIAPDEWLTVAARDAEGPLTPDQLYDVSTLVFRVKGSDILAFRAGRITRDEARKKVIVQEF